MMDFRALIPPHSLLFNTIIVVGTLLPVMNPIIANGLYELWKSDRKKRLFALIIVPLLTPVYYFFFFSIMLQGSSMPIAPLGIAYVLLLTLFYIALMGKWLLSTRKKKSL